MGDGGGQQGWATREQDDEIYSNCHNNIDRMDDLLGAMEAMRAQG